MLIRTVGSSDYDSIIAVVDDWWGGRTMRDMLPRLCFDHFRKTSFVAIDGREIAGFLIGFLSPSEPSTAYVHFIGVERGQATHCDDLSPASLSRIPPLPTTAIPCRPKPSAGQPRSRETNS